MDYDWIAELFSLLGKDVLYNGDNVIAVERLIGSVRVKCDSMQVREFKDNKEYDVIVDAEVIVKNKPSFDHIYFLLKRYGNLDYYDVKAVAFICEGNYYYFDELNIDDTMIYQKTHRLSVYDRDEFESLYNTVITDQAMLPTRKTFNSLSIKPDYTKVFYIEEKAKKISPLVYAVGEYNEQLKGVSLTRK